MLQCQKLSNSIQISNIYSQAVALHRLHGVNDLLDLVVHHAVQLTVSDPVSIHDDALREAVVVPVILAERRWK